MAENPYALKHPVVATFKQADGSERQDELLPKGHLVTIRRPKGKDLALVDGLSEMKAVLKMVEVLGGLDAAAVREMDAEDILHLGSTVSDFFPGGLPNGETSSAT